MTFSVNDMLGDFYLTTASVKYMLGGKRQSVWMAAPYERIRSDVRAQGKVAKHWQDLTRATRPTYFTLKGFVSNAEIYAFADAWNAADCWFTLCRFSMNDDIEMVGTLRRASRAIDQWHIADIEFKQYSIITEIGIRYGDDVRCKGWGGEWAPTRLYFRHAADAAHAKLLYT